MIRKSVEVFFRRSFLFCAGKERGMKKRKIFQSFFEKRLDKTDGK